jgi:hypothetical protein
MVRTILEPVPGRSRCHPEPVEGRAIKPSDQPNAHCRTRRVALSSAKGDPLVASKGWNAETPRRAAHPFVAVALRRAQGDVTCLACRVWWVARKRRSRFGAAQRDIARRACRAASGRGVVDWDAVSSEVWIRRHDRERLRLGLRDEETIERIAVMRRQLRNGDDVVETNR